MNKFIHNRYKMDLVVKECANSKINVRQLLECTNSNIGNQLFFSTGRFMTSLGKEINYVPWIQINDVYDHEIQKEAEFNLINFLCEKFKNLNNQVNIYNC